MSANESLQEMQSQLLQLGVHDVKFCFHPGLKKFPSSEVAGNVATFLSTYLKGQMTEYDPSIARAAA